MSLRKQPLTCRTKVGSLVIKFEIRGDYSGRSEFNLRTLTEWNGKDLNWAVERTVKFLYQGLVLAGGQYARGNEEDGKALE